MLASLRNEPVPSRQEVHFTLVRRVLVFSSQRSHELAIRTALGIQHSNNRVRAQGGSDSYDSRCSLRLGSGSMVNRALHSVIFGVGSVDVTDLAMLGLLIAFTATVPLMFRQGGQRRSIQWRHLGESDVAVS